MLRSTNPSDPLKLPSPLTPSASPMEVARCSSLSLAERRKVLCQWHEDAVALERAAAEGMTGEGRSRLAEVTAALEALERDGG